MIQKLKKKKKKKKKKTPLFKYNFVIVQDELFLNIDPRGTPITLTWFKKWDNKSCTTNTIIFGVSKFVLFFCPTIQMEFRCWFLECLFNKLCWIISISALIFSSFLIMRVNSSTISLIYENWEKEKETAKPHKRTTCLISLNGKQKELHDL